MSELFSLLKDFDIANILPEMSEYVRQLVGWMRVLLLAGPLVMAGMGVWFYFAPPKAPNYSVGFRTKWSMTSLAAWRYAQRQSGMIYMILGGSLAVIVFLLSLLFGALSPVGMAVITLLCVIAEAVLAVLAYLLVEKLLRKHFDAYGDRI